MHALPEVMRRGGMPALLVRCRETLPEDGLRIAVLELREDVGGLPEIGNRFLEPTEAKEHLARRGQPVRVTT